MDEFAGGGVVALRVTPGPRADWYGPGVLAAPSAQEWVLQPDSDRVALRLGPVDTSGPMLRRPDAPRELPSEGLVLGAVQVPPSGQPVVFLADHPTTGGYPVVAVVREDDVARCAQLRPGDPVSLRPA